MKGMEYMQLFCKSSGSQVGETKALSVYLNRNPFGYQLAHVPKKKYESYFEYLMCNNTRGKYVCVICDGNYSSNHDVGIDCDIHPKLIWDCCEDTALALSARNMHRCVGPGEHFEKIQYIGKIQPYG